MLSRRTLSLGVVALTMMIFAGSTRAQTVNLKIGTVNPAQVFDKMAETADLKQTMQATQKAVQDDEQRKVNEVEEARKARNIYNQGTPEYNKANQVLIQKAIELQTWRQIMQQELQRQQKSQMRTLFKKIEAATKDVAQSKALDIVLVDQGADIPEDMDQISVEQLRLLINQRTMLYNNKDKTSHDITDAVITKLDTDYKAGKK